MKHIYFLIILSLLFYSCEKENREAESNETNDSIEQLSNFLFLQSSEWLVTDEWTDFAPFPYDTYHYSDSIWYYFHGDTILDLITVFDFDSIGNSPKSHIYNKIQYARKRYKWNLEFENPSNSSGTLYTKFGSAGFIRQDTINKKVFFAIGEDDNVFHPENYNLADNREYILYDFGLNVTDTLPLNVWNRGISNILTVDSIDYLNIDGKVLKLYKIYEHHYLYRGTIIEGIGSLNGLLTNNRQLVHFKSDEINYLTEP